MKKRVTSAVLALCMLLSLLPVSVWAAEESEPPTSGKWSDNLTWSYNQGVLTIKGSGLMEAMPEEVKQYQNDVTKIVINYGVMSVCSGAFKGWPNLTSVSLPSNFAGIEYDAFNGCSKLTEINFPNSLQHIGYNSFCGTGLTSVTIPEKVVYIPDGAFQDCTSLATVTLPNTIVYIGRNAFKNCAALTGINLSKGLAIIGESAFQGCQSLTEIVIPEDVLMVYKSAFEGCTGLTKVTFQGSIGFYDSNQFLGLGYRGSLPERLFADCTSLTGVTLPTDIGSLGAELFSNCTSLETITIPRTVKKIGENCFDGCTNLKQINFDGAGCRWDSIVPTSLGTVPDTLSITYSLPGGKCGDGLYWYYYAPNNVLVIRAYNHNSPAADRIIKKPSDGTPMGWEGQITGSTRILAFEVSDIEQGVFKDDTIIHTSFGPDSVPGLKIHHLLSEDTQTDQPTCAAESLTLGYKCKQSSTVECSSLNTLLKPRTIPVLPHYHINVDEDSRQPSCTQEGRRYWYRCPSCSTTLVEPVRIHVKEHNLVASNTIDSYIKHPTCTKEGSANMKAVCTICHNLISGKTMTKTLPPIGHNLDTTRYLVTVKQPTCEDPGIQGYKRFCSRCSYIVIEDQEEIPKNGHAWGEWIRTKEPTATEDGAKERTCFACKEIQTETIPATGVTTQYTITFNSQGGTTVSSITVNDGETVTKPADPTLAGHTFDGWYQNQDCTNPWNFDTNTVTADITLYAKWTAVMYTVTFNSQGGTTVSSITVNDGETVTKPADPTLAGHTFGGWYKEAACNTPWDFDIDIVTGATTLYAKWTADTPPTPTEYTITFDPNGGTGGGTLTTNPDGTLPALPSPDPHRDGYTFNGWFTEQTGGVGVNTTIAFKADTTVYAHWTQNSTTDPSKIYTITLNAGGGKFEGDKDTIILQTNQDGRLNSLPQPTRADYALYRWQDPTNPGVAWEPNNPSGYSFTSDAELEAIWGHTITFDPNGGAFEQGGGTVTTITDGNGQIVNWPVSPIWEGHTFDSWYTAKEGGDEVTLDTEFTDNVTVYAHWDAGTTDPGGDDKPDPPKTYTITFDHNGGSGDTTRTTGTNGRLTDLPSSSRSGYTFGGWYTAKEGGDKVSTETVFDKNTTVYARWTQNTTPDQPKTYTVTFDANGGTGGTTLTTGTDGKLTALPGDPSRSGYDFDGWYTAASGGTSVTLSTVFTQNTTVYAHWTAHSSVPALTRYRIYTPDYTSGGSYSVSHRTAVEGARITVELNPRSNYELDWLSATNLDTGRELRLTRRYRDEYTFIMPASDVEVDLSYVSRYTGGGSYYVTEKPPASTKPIRWYYSNGRIWHVTDGLVPGGTLLTRDMLLSILYNLDDTSSGEPTFWATNNHIVPDIYMSWLWGTDKTITREQTAMILYCYAGHKGYNTSQRAGLAGYADYRLLRPYAQPAMSWAHAVGLMSGTSDSTLSPLHTLTCDQTCLILSRFLSSVVWTR